jgi:hypothetical protein
VAAATGRRRGTMHRIAKKNFGFQLTFGDMIDVAEMTR